MKISFIGAGRLGGALAIALAQKGYEIENFVVRDAEKAKKIVKSISPPPKILFADDLCEIHSDLIFITTQDFEIAAAAQKLAENLKNKPFVFHTSGSLSSEILEKLKKKGCQTGSLHPLVSISDSFSGADSFKNVYFCIEGSRNSTELAEKIVADLCGKPFKIKSEFKTLYHASAVTACGHLVALIDIAIEMLSQCGLDETKSKEILMPLIESTVRNLSHQSTAQALTGTFARADVEIFEKHVAALGKYTSDEALEVYLQLGLRSVHLALEQGTEKDKTENLRNKISLAKKNLK